MEGGWVRNTGSKQNVTPRTSRCTALFSHTVFTVVPGPFSIHAFNQRKHTVNVESVLSAVQYQSITVAGKRAT